MLDLGRQKSQKIKAWKEELLNHHLFTPVGQVAFEGFTTFEHMTPDEALVTPMRPYNPGEMWGREWEYAWFRAKLTLPESVKGQRVILLGQMGGEIMVYLNGRGIGSIDKGHQYVTLTRCAQGGETFDILVETYAGHGARLENLGPCPPERSAIPETPGAQCTYNHSVLAMWNEEAYQLALDVFTLDWLLQTLPEKSLRAQKVAQALLDFVRIADFELAPEKRAESFIRARKALAPALSCRNGSTAPMMWIFGQSHIDLSWLWTIEETKHKSLRTYANQLALMEEYPEYRFLLCEPALLEMLKTQDADCWLRVKEAVKNGQIIPEGAFYVECDTNIPSGESLIRQLLLGKRWYTENLGIESKVAWQPDTFGFSAVLPQILKKMDVPYFASQKLTRADPESQRFPYQHFIWEGMDGSEVFALNFSKNNSMIDPVSFQKRWEEDRTQMLHIDTMLFPYGYGDGGGGPTRDMVEMARRMEDLEGAPRACYGGLREYFEFVEKQGTENRWVGELYLPWHRGTYTAQRRQKMSMRRLEEELREAEALLAFCEDEALHNAIREGWDALLFCQFHDLAGGVGIRRAHEEAMQLINIASKNMKDARENAEMNYYEADDDPSVLSLRNPLSWDRSEWVSLPGGVYRYVSVPAASSTPLMPVSQPSDASARETDNGICLENSWLSVEVDHCGSITALWDKTINRPLMRPGQKMNDWRLYKNVQVVYDAWELDKDWQEGILPEAFSTEVILSHASPSYCEVTISRQFGQSRSVQKMRLYASSRRIDFETEVDWRERRKMLKAHFESNVLSENVLNEIQFGYVARPAHDSHAFASDRYECCNHRYSALCEENCGFALLNNGIYGLSTSRGEMSLTLLRAPLVPDDTADRGIHTFTYALYPFALPFIQSGTVKEAYCLNQPIAALTGNRRTKQGIKCESNGIILETVKPAEDGRGLILRLYESLRTRDSATLHFPFDYAVYDSAMDEKTTGILLGEGKELTIGLTPFEIKTLRIVPL